jgi:crotonobetainyl-CoA:carnitine CoA-transferase CaiB-like acyl-CoA transferase
MRLAEPVQEAPKPTPAADPRRPLDGIRVIEVGQLTTGPLSGRLLGALGADVIKVEAPTGDPMRWYRPGIDKQGFFFSYYNTDKKSVAIDLKSPTGQQELGRLLGTADVLVQNLKQGALAKLGFDAAELERINPRLVSCDICGFGQDTLYAGRPALDSVVQAMSGGMDLNRVNGVPVKSGISAVDLKSALLAFGAIVAALLDRDKTGKGSAIDLSMQDVAAWTTAPFWNGNAEPTASTVIACTPGRVIAQASLDNVANIIKNATRADGRDAHLATELPAETVAATLSTSGITAAPLLSVSEALNAPQTKARNLHFELPGSDGQMWPAVAIPMRLSHTPAISKWVIGGLDSDRQMVLPMAAE